MLGGALVACGGAGTPDGAGEYIAAWADAWSSGDVYDTVAFYEPDVQVAIAQPDLELTFSAGTWDSTTQGEGRSWLANWLDRQTSTRVRRVDAAFVGGDAAAVVVVIDELDTAAWYAWELGPIGIRRQSTLRWRDAHKPLGVPDPRLAPVDDLLADYLAAWSDGDPRLVAGLYTEEAVFQVEGAPSRRGAAIVDGAAEHRLGGAQIAEVTAGTRVGPAVFVGRIERGEPVGFVVETVDGSTCSQRWSVTITVVDGQIDSEMRHPAAASAHRCGAQLPVGGWWERLDPPPPLEGWRTGELPNQDGSAIAILNGTAELETLVDWALARFSAAGLDPPLLQSVTFGPVPACAGRAGAVFDDGVGSPDLVQCPDAYATCVPTPADCRDFALTARFSLLHELAHVWLIQNVDVPTRGAFGDLFALADWDDRQVAWHERGVEHAAEVVAWGLLDEVVLLERIDDPPCERLIEGWILLTSTPAPRTCG